MKSKKVILIALASFCGAAFAVSFDTKSLITVSVTPVEQVTKSSKNSKTKETDYDSKKEFGGTYVQGDFALSNDKITAAGKIRYWVTPSTYSSDSVSQKIDLKRAYIRYRPFASNLLEVSLGKIYSYCFPGNYFTLADSYTGAARWGKTGIGAKAEYKGFLLGAALPVTESSVKIADSFGLAFAAGYDFSQISSLPLRLGADFSYTRTGPDYSSKDDIEDDADYDYSECVSLYFTPKLDGFISKLALTLTYSRNSSPFISSVAYKKVANYNNSDMKKSQFISWNYHNNFGAVQFLTEGEAGHSISGDMIPLYIGTQLLIPVYEKIVWFKPRFFYYSAIDTEDDDNSRHSFGFYPRAWITAGKYTVSAGVDILHKEYEKDYWKWEWEVPIFVQIKAGK